MSYRNLRELIMSTKRMNPKDRRVEILTAAMGVASKEGYNNFTRAQVAKEACCAESLVSVYFGTMIQFRRCVMRHAVKTEHLNIIAQGLMMKDDHAAKVSPDLRARALKALAI